mgnify:CR=1 FL=1
MTFVAVQDKIREPRCLSYLSCCCVSVIPFYNLLLEVCLAKMFLWFRTGFSTGGNLLWNPVVLRRLRGFADEMAFVCAPLCMCGCVYVGGRALSLLSS